MTRTFWITLVIALANSLSFTILIPILYLYGKEFQLSDLETSLLFAIYAGAQFFSTPVIGKLSDRYGRKPLLMICLAGTVLASFMAGTANTAWVLFLARFLDGITGGNLSVAQAIVSDITQPQERAKAFGVFTAVSFGLGLVVGPALSLLAQQVSLGAGFLASSALALVALLLTTFMLPETLPSPKSTSQKWLDLGLGQLISGLALPRIGILLIINFLIGTTFTIFTFAFQPYYIHVLHQDSQSLTLMFMVLGVMTTLVQAKGISLLTRSLSLNTILFAGLTVRGCSFLLLPLFPNLLYFVGVALIFSLFNSLVQPMIITLLSLNAKPEEQGTVLGLNASYLNVSNAFGPIIAGAMITQSDPTTYRYPLFVAGALTLGVLLFAIAKRNQYKPLASKP
jgi:predicted MFS family arabinose efflux permease